MPYTKIYGVLGYPAKHSLSPVMHNAAFKALRINAEYKIFEIEPSELNIFLSSLAKNNIFGLNVTVPYKEKVMPSLDSISSEAELIGAVNTIKVSKSRLEGFNTDGSGFLKSLSEDLNFEPKGKNIAILGAGGAAKAVSVCLSKTKPKAIAIYDIDKPKLMALVSHLKKIFGDVNYAAVNSVAELDMPNLDLLINATPIGMKDSDPCLVNPDALHSKLLVYDLIYNPAETKLLALAKEVGAKVSNGLGMLLHQGALSFELWTDKKAPVKVMREVLEKEVRKL
ncbi:MAG: shikimate dehydrogenase [Candidatus Omnitrophica bacterium]|nr:shikimate dehydrogenase [Candidatus Omnitrophota bacterium]